MGRSDKKKKRKRSRSRSRERSRDSEKRRPKKQRSSSSDSESDRDRRRRDRSRSKDRQKQKHRHRSRSPRAKRKEVPMDPQQLKEQKRKEKELLKATESLEEKRARRLAKKTAKDRKRKEQMGWDQEMMGYTNEDNPFGDSQLLETFVWHKKNDQAGLSDLGQENLKKLVKDKQIENRLELQKVKQRRHEREKEREQREKEMEELQRMREAEYFKEWEHQEDSFHLQQAKMRSNIRIQDGRAKPIDLLAHYVGSEDNEDLSVEMQEPYNVLKGLTIQDCEDLLEDIKVYVELEQGKNAEFWKDMTIITEDEMTKLKKIAPELQDGADRREGINASVSNEVANVFQGKSHSQLLALKGTIMQRIKSGKAGVDIGYWESLLQQLNAHMARARLRERHQEKLRHKLASLRQQQQVDTKPLFPAGTSEDSKPQDSGEIPLPSSDSEEDEVPVKQEPSTSAVKQEPSTSAVKEEPSTSGAEAKAAEEPESVFTEEDLMEESKDEYLQGGYSPKLLSARDLPPDTFVFDPDEDAMKLTRTRDQLITTGSAEATVESEFIKQAKAGMDNDEATFAVEVNVENKPYLWQDKYRPRKPRFFNRVHTGFEWNKYNQTHYDMDNPPPKIVQGYKFNIFYPDLIDKRNTPEYTLTPSSDNEEFAVLRFQAGPPYEDIAFKIVNREWEYSHRHGFRCQFNNSIFQLWFRFKRYRYRR
ncbi:splicing factor Cactin-like [Amphiura filiformis]|uniref:splicing factor Cactin-like n=1 Tax=Amphiura filiformis TaxID=82378 RepID=UPI003B21ECEB